MKIAVLEPRSSHASAWASTGDALVVRRSSMLLARSQLMGTLSPVPAFRRTSNEGNDSWLSRKANPNCLS